jgi:hypothetical protein
MTCSNISSYSSKGWNEEYCSEPQDRTAGTPVYTRVAVFRMHVRCTHIRYDNDYRYEDRLQCALESVVLSCASAKFCSTFSTSLVIPALKRRRNNL